MPSFHYQGRDQEGKLVKGIASAENMNAMADQLNNEGITPIQIRPAKENFSFSFEKLKTTLFLTKVTNETILIFCRQMYSLLKAGVPVVSAIARLLDILPTSNLTITLHAIEDKLKSGESLSVSMKRHPKVFSKLIVALVSAGEASGRLDEAFLQAAKHYELETTTRKRVKGALRYPIFVLLAITGALIIINVFVIPRFSALYSHFHAGLPLPTRILLAVSNFLIHDWYYLIAAIVILAVLFSQLIKLTDVEQGFIDGTRLFADRNHLKH